MYILKVDRNEYTEDGKKVEVWGYSLSIGGKVLKSEIIKARLKPQDNRLMCYLRCYKWAFEKVSGYFKVNDMIDDVLSIYFTNSVVEAWLVGGKVHKDYRIVFDEIMGVLDDIPMTLRFNKVERNWAFRRTLVAENIQRERYSSVTSFLDTVEE